MPSGQAATILSRDEVAEAIRALAPANWVRLRRMAGYYSRGRRLGAEDLLQEAFTRALETRSCPAHVDVVRFLIGAMRSIASDTDARTENRVVLIPVAKTGEPEADEIDLPEPSATAEARMIEAEECTRLRSATLDLFRDDPEARDILEGKMEGMEADELRELTGLDHKGYASKLRLIRRRIDGAFPEGWKS